ncbi:hypothetical protein [Actinomyces naeslundii]|mgnify:CR=1 FL=1|uniref:hypothetical protein n=1 Tax=Actinomyces naeslundii TaxID=1655 RepID=UPI00209A6ADB|nr:hypothetical protein [Actinomyces naeslundii]
MIGNALNRVASAVDAAYSRWLEDVLGRTAGPAASSYAQGIQALIKGDFRVDDAVCRTCGKLLRTRHPGPDQG